MAQNPIETLGGIVYLMMRAGSYGDMTLSELRSRCLPAMDFGLAVTASNKPAADGSAGQPIAFALFAKVSEDWHEQLKDTGFNMADLPRDAWNSGQHQWLLDLVASKDTAGAFAMQAAAKLFEKGSTLNIRLLDENGQVKVADKTV